MKIRTVILAVCASTIALAQAGIAQAIIDPIPGIDIIVKKNPGGMAITVGDCQAGGGKVVKIKGQWSCTGLSKTGKTGAVGDTKKAGPCKTGTQAASGDCNSALQDVSTTRGRVLPNNQTDPSKKKN